MKLNKLAILIFLTVLNNISFSQDIIKFDTIQLISGAKLPVTLLIKQADLLKITNVKYIEEGGKLSEIPKSYISKITKFGGKVIYLKKEESDSLENEEETPKPVCDLEEANAIKLRINNYVKNRIKTLKNNKILSNTNYIAANKESNNELKENLYEELYQWIVKYNCTDASLVSDLEILVDESGKFINLNSEIESITKSSFYEDLEKKHIIPYLKKYSFDEVELKYGSNNEYDSLYNLFYEDMKSSKCDLSEFNYALKLAKLELEKLKETKLKVRVMYKIPLNYSFTNNFQLWRLKNDEVTLKKNFDMVLTDSSMINQFFANTNKRKKGVYEVNVCTSELLENDLQVKLTNIKKRNNRWIKFGLIGIKHLETDLAPGGDDINLDEQYFYSASIIINRIGFFYGSKYNGSNPTSKKNGLFITNDSKYHEGGMYFGLSNTVFLKLGYQNLNGELEEFNSNGINTNNSNYNTPFSQSGIVAGLALAFPVFHAEVGYNYIFDSFYVGAGLNIPIKR